MGKKPVQFLLPDRDVGELSRLATQLGMTKSEVVRNSLEVYGLLRRALDQGGEIVIERDGVRERLARI